MLIFADRPAWPNTPVMIKELRDSARRVVWSDDPGYLFRFLKNGDPLAPDDQTEYGLQTAIYKTKGWEENGAVVAPVFALTEVANGKEISKSKLPKVFSSMRFRRKVLLTLYFRALPCLELGTTKNVTGLCTRISREARYATDTVL